MKLKFDIQRYEKEHRNSIKMILYYFCVLFSGSGMIFSYLGAFFSDGFYLKAESREVIDKSGQISGDNYSSKWYFVESAIVILLCFLMKYSYDYDFLSFEIIYENYNVLPTHWLFVYVILAALWRLREKSLRKLYSFDMKKTFFICLPIIVTNIFAFLVSRKIYLETYEILYEIWSALFISACVEEVFFRGYLYELFKKITSNKVAAVLSSLIFMMWHTSLIRMLFDNFNVDVLQNLITIFGLGIIETVIYERTNSLITCILFHAINNGIIMYIIFIMSCIF